MFVIGDVSNRIILESVMSRHGAEQGVLSPTAPSATRRHPWPPVCSSVSPGEENQQACHRCRLKKARFFACFEK